MSIRVYTGRGTSRDGAPLLIEELGRHTDIQVSEIKEDEMCGSEDWKRNTTTLIFAGQSVREFKQALGEEAQCAIRHLVYNGAMNYVGICAGSAFASSKIKYRVKDFPDFIEKKIENTGLSFFNGLATGPCRSVTSLPFSGGSENLHLITLHSLTDGKNFNAFHWGGPALIPEKQHDNGRILSCLKTDGTPMSLQFRYGDGLVTLCSYHPEIHADNIGRWAQARYLNDKEAYRLEHLSKQLDGTAFSRFLHDTGLKSNLNVPENEFPVYAV